jgi:hypothetical protein
MSLIPKLLFSLILNHPTGLSYAQIRQTKLEKISGKFPCLELTTCFLTPENHKTYKILQLGCVIGSRLVETTQS